VNVSLHCGTVNIGVIIVIIVIIVINPIFVRIINIGTGIALLLF
jgi:hypothetical protein